MTQVVIDPSKSFYKGVDHWRVESTLCFTGDVVERIPEAINDKLDTGEIEIAADEMNKHWVNPKLFLFKYLKMKNVMSLCV